MAEKKAIILRYKCKNCKRLNYYAKKKKAGEKKLTLQRYCKWCRKHTAHQEGRK